MERGSSGSLYTSFTTVASNFTTESAPGRKMFNVRQHRNVDSLSDFSESRGCEIPALDKVHKAPATDSMKKEISISGNAGSRAGYLRGRSYRYSGNFDFVSFNLHAFLASFRAQITTAATIAATRRVLSKERFPGNNDSTYFAVQKHIRSVPVYVQRVPYVCVYIVAKLLVKD